MPGLSSNCAPIKHWITCTRPFSTRPILTRTTCIRSTLAAGRGIKTPSTRRRRPAIQAARDWPTCGLRLKQRWLYLFDYGDQHEFDVQLIATSSDQPRGEYPRLIEQHGQMPPQYPNWEDEDEEWTDEEDEGEELTDDDLDTDPAL